MLKVQAGAVSEPQTARGRARYLTEGGTPEQAERVAAYLAAGTKPGKDPWEVLADVLAERVDKGLTDYSHATEILLGEMAADSLERGDLNPVHGHRVPHEDPEALELRAQEMLDAALDRRMALDGPIHPEGPVRPPEPGVALPVRGMDTKIAEVLGVGQHQPLTEAQLANVMAGRRADGGDLPEAPGRKREVAYLEMVFSAPKSVSVAYALAETDAERRAIVETHREAVEVAFAAAMTKVANARRGADRRPERGHAAAWHLEHYSSRPTVELPAVDKVTGEAFTKFADVPVRGDPQLHTHLVVPNCVVAESGHVGSLDSKALHGRLIETGTVYQAALATGLRRRGIHATLRDGYAHVPAIPDRVADHFSRRSRQTRDEARKWAAERGLDWDLMSDQAKAAALETAVKTTRLAKDGHVADFADWRRQAEEIGYTHKPVLSPEHARAPRENRIELAWATALPFLEKKLEGRAVIAASEIRTVAAQGLIATGMEDWRDVDRVTALFRDRGVRQDGKMTNLLWDRDPDGAVWISTRMHEAQEEEFVAIARRLGVDRSGAVRRLDTTGLTDEQAAAAEALSMRGRFAVAFGAAGVGKTHAIRPVVAAHHAEGYETWGISLANRQANELPEAGIEKARTMAVHPFLSRVKDGEITLGPKSLVVVDEVALLGTRQGLELLRIAEKTGAKFVAVGDPAQSQSINAGSFSELSARALGEANVPNMVRTVRQHSEREREIAELLRTGKTLEALRMKREDGTLEFVAGDRQAAVERVAALWAERTRANAHRPDFALTVSAPTHDDVHDLGAAIRRASGAGEAMVTVKAQDGGGTVRRLDLSEGTRLRLFARVWGQADDGRKVKAGDNGDTLTVLRADGQGMRFRNRRGDEGWVGWEKFARHGGLPRLAYGYVQTTIVVQGATSHEHIAVLLGGSRSITGNALYVYGSRHRETAHVVVSDARERQDVAHKRPHGDARPIRTEDLVENMAQNLRAPGHKDTALRLIDRAVALVREAPVRPDLSIAGTRHVMGQRHQRALRQSL